eukprot:6230883-Pyramimonas_sp.AAC.1
MQFENEPLLFLVGVLIARHSGLTPVNSGLWLVSAALGAIRLGCLLLARRLASVVCRRAHVGLARTEAPLHWSVIARATLTNLRVYFAAREVCRLPSNTA